MVDPGGSQWWILGDRSCEIHVDPSNGSWWILVVYPGESHLWILVKSN